MAGVVDPMGLALSGGREKHTEATGGEKLTLLICVHESPSQGG